jgi:4-hydroxybenzoyl-CoA thioesterase
MARVEIDLPDSFLFETEIPVRVGDVNYGGHLGNDAVLSIVQEARARFLAAHGMSELDVGGPGIVLADAALVYRAEGTWGMCLRVAIAAADVRSRGLDLLYRLTDAATGREIARVKTGILFFDYRTRKVVSMTAAFRAALGSGEADSPG